MAREKPLTDTDREIGRRLREIRKRYRMSKADLAFWIGCDAGQIERIELGRAALKYGMASMITKRFSVDGQWLATGKESLYGRTILEAASEIGVDEKARLSGVFDEVIQPITEAANAEILPPGEPISKASDAFAGATNRVSRAHALKRDVDRWLADIPFEQIDSFLDNVRARANELMASYPADAWNERALRRALMAKIREREKKPDPDKDVGKSELTYCDTSHTKGAVKDRWPRLKRELQRATASKGLKARLARFLDVDPSMLSKWLTESNEAREPGAEYCLQMMAWLDDLKRTNK